MNTDKPHQRKGSSSNTQVGKDFENAAQAFFAAKGVHLIPNLSVAIGINGKKEHKFDLGDPDKKVIVECKSHTWTEGDNVPSAKMTTWNQAMYFFHAAPHGFRKIFFALRDFSEKRQETLADYYLRTYPHLIPADVEIWEFDEKKNQGKQLK